MTARISRSADLRRALKRGRAREALVQSAAEHADLATLFRLAADLRPNPRNLARVARRLARLPGYRDPAVAGAILPLTRWVPSVSGDDEGARRPHPSELQGVAAKSTRPGGRSRHDRRRETGQWPWNGHPVRPRQMAPMPRSRPA